MAGSQRGVQDFPIRTGWVFYMPGKTEIMEYPTFVQTATWTGKDGTSGREGYDDSLSFVSKDGMTLAADVNLSYALAPDKVPQFFVKFRTDDLDKFTHGYLHNVAKDAFNELGGTYTAEEIYAEKKGEFLQKVKDRINGDLATAGVDVVHIEQFGFIGPPHIPEQMLQALNGKVTAIQKAQQAQNELAQATAEANKEVAQAQGEARSRVARAQGEADANKALTSSITPTLLEWKRLDIQNAQIQKWNGDVPSTVLGSSGSNPTYLVPLK